MKHRIRGSLPTPIYIGTLIFSSFLGLALSAPGWCQEKTKEEEAEKQAKKIQITEEIVVVGRAPRLLPVATVTTITTTQIEERSPLDLAEAIKYAPGVMVTFGDKDTYTPTSRST